MNVFFTDGDLGSLFPRVLRDVGLRVERHDDHFGHSTLDEQWLPVVGKHGWYALTHDKRIRYKPNQRDAVMRAGVGLFVLIGSAPHKAMADNFIATVPKVEVFIENNPRPFIAKVYRPVAASGGGPGGRRAGRVTLWLSHEDWLRGA